MPQSDDIANVMTNWLQMQMQHGLTLDTIRNQMMGYAGLAKYQSKLEGERQKESLKGYQRNAIEGGLFESLSKNSAEKNLSLLEQAMALDPDLAQKYAPLVPMLKQLIPRQAQTFDMQQKAGRMGLEADVIDPNLFSALQGILPSDQASTASNVLVGKATTPPEMADVISRGKNAEANLLNAQKAPGGGESGRRKDLVDMTDANLKLIEKRIEYLTPPKAGMQNSEFMAYLSMRMKDIAPEMYKEDPQGNWVKEIGLEFWQGLAEAMAKTKAFSIDQGGITKEMLEVSNMIQNPMRLKMRYDYVYNMMSKVYPATTPEQIAALKSTAWDVLIGIGPFTLSPSGAKDGQSAGQ